LFAPIENIKLVSNSVNKITSWIQIHHLHARTENKRFIDFLTRKGKTQESCQLQDIDDFFKENPNSSIETILHLTNEKIEYLKKKLHIFLNEIICKSFTKVDKNKIKISKKRKGLKSVKKKLF
jgi:hypothetical protein